MISRVMYSKMPYVLVVIGGIGKAFMRPFMQASQRGKKLQMFDLVIDVT
jgi:hypothetical protein